MDQKQILKQMTDFCQATFDSAFNANALLQDQFELVANTVLEQATWLPSDGRKAIENWVEACKTGRTNYKKYVDDSYKKVQAYFSA
jgi:hypothetical protein